jgi:hypothetical protein
MTDPHTLSVEELQGNDPGISLASYTPTTWVDGVTPVDAAHLNPIETALAGLDADVITSGGRLAPTAKLITDWNTATVDGFYRAAGTALNGPGVSCVGLVLVDSTNYLLQICWAHNDTTLVGPPITVPRMMIRTRVGGTWNSWARFDLPGYLTTKGDLLGFSTAPVRHPAGNNGQLLASDSGQTNGLGWRSIVGTSAVQTVSAAGTDLAWMGAYQHETLCYVTTGGGTLRSIGSPIAGAGSVVVIRNGSGSAFTCLHQSAGGTGLMLYLLGGANLVLQPNELVTLMFDGSNWLEVSRDVAVSAGVAYIPVELRNPQQVNGGVYPNIVAMTAYERWWWEFANADCKIWGQFAVPPNSTPVLANQQIILDLACALTTGNARFNVKTLKVADGGSTNPAALNAVTSQDVIIPSTANLKKRVTFAVSAESWAAGDTVIVEVMREGAHANDTLAGVCGLLGIYARLT